MHISIAQAVSLWAELERGLRGESGFGGNTVELYAYKLQPYSPAVHTGNLGGGLYREVADRLADQAAADLKALLRLFEEEHEECRCSIRQPGGEALYYTEWTGPLDHRVHVVIEVQ